ncbi:hypothetical protein GCM10009634_53630 [Saccharothrix xinjiangensis]
MGQSGREVAERGSGGTGSGETGTETGAGAGAGAEAGAGPKAGPEVGRSDERSPNGTDARKAGARSAGVSCADVEMAMDPAWRREPVRDNDEGW